MIQEKCKTEEIQFKINVLAISDQEMCQFRVHNNTTVIASAKCVSIAHDAVYVRSIKIPIDIYSPRFDPDKLADKIIGLSKQVDFYAYEMRSLLNQFLSDFDGGVGNES